MVSGDSMIGIPWRIGWGHDIHRVGQGGPLRLGGIAIPWDHHLVGHSDADVLLHALIDALLGALAWGDIGEWFPDSGAQYRRKDSTEMVQFVAERVRSAGWSVVNVDSTVFAEQPKLTPYKAAVRQRIAELLKIPVEQVSVKAKTGEKLDAIGRGEAIAAACIVLVAQTGSQNGLAVPTTTAAPAGRTTKAMDSRKGVE